MNYLVHGFLVQVFIVVFLIQSDHVCFVNQLF